MSPPYLYWIFPSTKVWVLKIITNYTKTNKMKKAISLLMLLGIAASLATISSCKKEDPIPLPEPPKTARYL